MWWKLFDLQTNSRWTYFNHTFDFHSICTRISCVSTAFLHYMVSIFPKSCQRYTSAAFWSFSYFSSKYFLYWTCERQHEKVNLLFWFCNWRYYLIRPQFCGVSVQRAFIVGFSQKRLNWEKNGPHLEMIIYEPLSSLGMNKKLIERIKKCIFGIHGLDLAEF